MQPYSSTLGLIGHIRRRQGRHCTVRFGRRLGPNESESSTVYDRKFYMYDIYIVNTDRIKNAKSIFFFFLFIYLCFYVYYPVQGYTVKRQEELITIQYYQAGLQMCIPREPSSRSPSRPVMARRQVERAERVWVPQQTAILSDRPI